MRQAFQRATSEMLASRNELVVLLGDIGVYSFRREMEAFPERVLNFGIMEQAMVSFGAGLASMGYIPVLHSISPFLVERPLEQIKVDFGYQGLAGNLVGVGASFDYAALGGTHHSPGDVAAMSSIPGVQILIPGHPNELTKQINTNFANHKLSYFRLSEKTNSRAVVGGQGAVCEIQPGVRGSVIAIGPALDFVLEAVGGSDIQILYLNEIFDGVDEEIQRTPLNPKLAIVEPFYEGTSARFLRRLSSRVEFIGVPNEFIHRYGSADEHFSAIGFDSDSLRNRIIGALT